MSFLDNNYRQMEIHSAIMRSADAAAQRSSGGGGNPGTIATVLAMTLVLVIPVLLVTSAVIGSLSPFVWAWTYKWWIWAGLAVFHWISRWG